MAKKARIEPFDDYPTGVCDARFLIGLLPETPSGRILEPHANRGNFLQAILAESNSDSRVYANELQAKYIPGLREIIPPCRVRHGDFLSVSPHQFQFDWIIGNPPFTGNTGIIHTKHALRLSRNVAFFLPLRYVCSKTRFPFWRDNPQKYFWPIAERPVFVGGRGGRTDYAFFWWKRGHRGPAMSEVVSLIE